MSIENGATAAPTPPSVLLLTKDEEVNIRACLESLSFSDDIVVLDSFSGDSTVEIAREFPNVRIVQRKFDTWSRHSNWALDNIRFKHPWVYYSDADERVPDDLRDELLRVVNDPTTAPVAFRLRYKNMFMGRWIRHGGIYPVWIMRLYRPDSVRYEERDVNAHPIVRGATGDLQGHFVHYSFSKGLRAWFDKHNSYSEMEATEALRIIDGPFAVHVRGLFSSARGARRRGLKNLSFFFPFRGAARFVWTFFLQGGFLDGLAGLHYCLLLALYEYWIELKIRERRKSWAEATAKIVGSRCEGAAR